MVIKDSREHLPAGGWRGDCGHAVPADSPLGRYLDGLRPRGPAPLDANRPAEMEDWRPSATR